MDRSIYNDDHIEKYSRLIEENDHISHEDYEEYDIKKGLRDKSGKGVLAGVTNISMVNGSREENGKRIPIKGELFYRGYNIKDLVKGAVSR